MIILIILCIIWWLVYVYCLQVNWEWVLSTNWLLFASFLDVVIQSLLYLWTAWLFFEWKCLINNTVNFMQVEHSELLGFWTFSIQWLRLALSNGPNWVGSSSPPPPEDGNRSSFRNVVFCRIPDDGKSPNNPVILCVIHHRQNHL
jgi:hypothetical protein